MNINQTVKNISIAWSEARARIVLNTTLANIVEFGEGHGHLTIKAYEQYFESVNNAKKRIADIAKNEANQLDIDSPTTMRAAAEEYEYKATHTISGKRTHFDGFMSGAIWRKKNEDQL